MAFASAMGVFVASTYSKESVLWAAQGIGQDIANLFFVFPALLISLYFVNKGSLRGILIWLGLLIYIIYSYLVYAFFVHFGPFFLIYIAILGLSFYSFVSSLMSLDWNVIANRFSNIKTKPASIFLMIFAVALSFVWLSDILLALFTNVLPQELADIGIPVNPVHVLDLAFFLPAAAIVSVSLWKREKIGLVFVVPFLSFIATMAAAIFSIALYTNFQRFPSSVFMEISIAVVIAASLFLLIPYLRSAKT